MKLALGNYRKTLTKTISLNKGDVFKRYIFFETNIENGEFDINQCKRATIVAYVDKILPSPIVKNTQEEDSRINTYFADYLPLEPGKITKGDILRIREAHYSNLFNTDMYGKTKPVEVYNSFDVLFYDTVFRFNDWSEKKLMLTNPFPEYFTIEDQMKTRGDCEDFGSYLTKTGSYEVKLGDLIDDEYTTVQSVNFSTSLAEKPKNLIFGNSISDNYRGNSESELFSMISMVKAAVETNGFRKSLVIFDNYRGMNFLPDYADVMAKTVSEEQKRLMYVSAVKSIDIIFENMFINGLNNSKDLNREDLVIYMYFAPYTNKVKIFNPSINLEQQVNLPLDEMVEEIVENKSIG